MGLILLTNEFGVDTDRPSNDPHVVPSGGSGPVGADHGGVYYSVTRTEGMDEDILSAHPLSGESEGRGRSEWETFRDDDGDQRGRDDEDAQEGESVPAGSTTKTNEGKTKAARIDPYPSGPPVLGCINERIVRAAHTARPVLPPIFASSFRSFSFSCSGAGSPRRATK